MRNRSMKNGLALLTGLCLVAGSAFASEYVLDDFENRDGGSDVMNYNNGAWYLYDDGTPSWKASSWDDDAGYYNDENGMLEGGSSRFTHISGMEIGEVGYDTTYLPGGTHIHEISKNYPSVVAADGIGYDGGRGFSASFIIDEEVRPQYDHHDDLRYNNFVGIGTGLKPTGQYAILEEGMTISFYAKADLPDEAELFEEDLVVEFSVGTAQKLFDFRDWSYSVNIEVGPEWQRYDIVLEHEHDSVKYFDEDNHDPSRFRLDHAWASRGDIWEPEIDEEGDIEWVQRDGEDNPERHFFGFEAPDAETFAEWAEAAPRWDRAERLQWSVEVRTGDAHTSSINSVVSGEEVTLYIDNITISDYTPVFEDQLPEEDAWNTDFGTDGSLIWNMGPTNLIGEDDEGTFNAWYEYGSTGSELTLDEVTDETDELHMNFVLGGTEETESSDGDLVLIQPYAGLAMNMFTARDESEWYNAEGHGYDGLRFTYSTSAEVEWLQVRIYDSNEFEQSGTSFYVAVPGTNGETKTATISFDDLTLPWWNSQDRDKSFRPNEIENIAFVYQGQEADEGSIEIHNVRFVEGTHRRTRDITDLVVSDTQRGETNFSLRVDRDAVNLAIPQNIESATAMIYSVNGQLIQTQDLVNSGSVASISTDNLSNGTYILRAVSKGGESANFVRAFTVQR
ncbi:carbohydrate binding domain-containing protein [Chitinivibrio alkaliphilus]|uniref:Secretion system C-terminal sorting domain-containing protein n=1 Tax=Chitinivibrio alkaliphilus ACht1 TaxID=1313304 RepID=U7DAN8_9BACT|nr:carbohydrate binding domain-containing protein [Chitinivibrio alkaliphilus]ERP31460.1 hypothetical protein CALK_1664 [Chitinivibrio alkaliphilus ACht1]